MMFPWSQNELSIIKCSSIQIPVISIISNFKQHVGNAIMKINKNISVIKKLRYDLERKSHTSHDI